MNSIVNNMPKYDHRQHVLSDWLAELDQRFQLGEVGKDRHKITWCQLLIGTTGSSILSGLEDDASWETAKETLLSRLGIGSVKDEAWAALKKLKKGSKEIVELAGEVEKLAKRLHPRDEEAAERHATDAFLSALERPLAAEVQKLGYHKMESVVAAARRIEKILAEQTDSKMERLIQDQIRLLKKDLKDTREQISNPTAALAANPTPTVAAAQPPPPAFHWPPPPAPARRSYQEYPEPNPHYSPPRRQSDRRSPCCFLCGEEGHLAANCPARPVLQRLLRQQTHTDTRSPPPGQFSESAPTKDGSQITPNIPVRLLEGSSKAKVTPVGCVVGPPITGQLTLEGIPVHGLVDTGASVTCMGFLLWWRYRAQWGPLKPFKEIGTDSRENTAFGPAMGRSTRTCVRHCHYGFRVTALLDWDGHHAAAPRPHWCHQWHHDSRSARPTNSTFKRGPAAESSWTTAGYRSPAATLPATGNRSAARHSPHR